MNRLPQLIFRLLHDRLALIVLLTILWPFMIIGAMRAWDGMTNRVEDWLPAAFEETKYLVRFVDVFGSDELLMISWDDCRIDDPRLDDLKKRLMTPIAADGREVLYFHSVLTGTELYHALTSEPMNLDEDAARERLSGWILSPDGIQTCAVLTVSEDGAANRRALLDRVWEVIREIGLETKDAHVAGPTIESTAIDDASRNGILTLNLISFLACFGVTYFCLRSFRVAAIILGTAIFNQYMTMSLVYYCGVTFDSVMLMAANLTFIVTFSMGIYLTNYYRAALFQLEPKDAVLQALRHAFVPAMLSALTTSVGLFSLMVSNLIPISRFGLFGGAAVGLSVCIILIYIPLFFFIWPVHSWKNNTAFHNKEENEDKEKNEGVVTDDEATESWKTSKYLTFIERFVFPIASRKYAFLFVTFSLIAIAGLGGIKDITASVGLRQFLMGHTKVIRDYCYLEEKLGPLIPIEILVCANRDADKNVMLQRLRTVDRVQEELKKHFHDAAIIGLKNFLPDIPQGGGVRQMARVSAFRNELASRRSELSELGYFAEKDGLEYWRITARTFAMSKVDYVQFRKTVEQTVDSVLNDSTNNPDHQLSYIVTGGIPLTAKTQNQLIKDMIDSFMLAFALIAVTLAILFRSIPAGLFGVIPSIMPGIIVFGVMGWAEIPLEIGTALTACSALGISVDATIHFVIWFRKGVAAGMSKPNAVLNAYRRCSQGMMQTTLICSFGLLVFSATTFIPMIRFGLCMFSLLMLSYLFTMLLLPAILCSPLGNFFVGRKS